MSNRLVSVLLPACLLLAAPGVLPAAEIFTNGSFELNPTTGGLPAGWTFQGASPAALQSSTTSAQAGTRSARVTGRTDSLDGPRQSIAAALTAGGNGVPRRCRCWVRLDDFASVRVLLRLADASGQQPDLILAEQVVLTPHQWVLVEGSSTIAWSGALTAASVRLEVVQPGRAVAPFPAALLPDYYADGFSLDDDTDGDGLMDRDEAALGCSATRADTDGDGLPDGWERDHGFSAATSEGTLDTDGDGFTNVQEFGAATDPRDAGSYPGRPANPHLNAAARSVLQWLALLPSQTSGRHLAVGQTVTDLGSATEYPAMIDALGSATGRSPAILSLAIESPFDRFGIPLQIAAAESRARAFWQAGGLVLMKWAIYNPWTGKNGNDQTGVDLPGLLDPASSTPDRRAANQAAHDQLLGWMGEVGDALARLQQDGVVVLFRPCSEMNGGWFWWGLRERADYVALWSFLYDYFTTTRGLNNLIWVYESDSATHTATVPGGQGVASDYYYPGDDRVDVTGHNLYSATWVLNFNANEIYRRHPKVYGIPQAGPDRATRDGTFDNLTYVTRSEAGLPRSSFFIVWNSFISTDPVTQQSGYSRLALVDNLNAIALMLHPSVVTRETLPLSLFRGPPPAITASPASRSVAAGVSTTFATTAASAAGPVYYQWLFNGQPIAGATSSSFLTGPTSAASAGLYAVRVTDATGTTTSAPAILGVTAPGKLTGAAAEVGTDIRHPNGRIYDQVLLEGSAASVNADPNEVVRLSFIDLNDDIVQVEFSGAGTLSVSLDHPAGPAAPLHYHQPATSYLKGHATLVIAGADETTNLSVFTVGRLTAFDPTGSYDLLLPAGSANDPAANGSPLFAGHTTTAYDGIADLALIAITSANGRFGGLRCANASFWAAAGFTGLYAPGVQFTGPVYLHDVNAQLDDTPVLITGPIDPTGEIRITGGNLQQPNRRAVQVGAITRIQMAAGVTSHNVSLPAQASLGVLERDGVDVTASLIVNP